MLKKVLMIIVFSVVSIMSFSMNVNAKTIVVPDYDLSESFLEKHKEDVVYVWFQGICVNNEGDGVVTGYSTCNIDKRYEMYNYVSYKYVPGMSVGKTYTTILKIRKGAECTDDIVERIDIEGYKFITKKMLKNFLTTKFFKQ